MKQCSWERCIEPATQIARWHNEDRPPKPDTLASYCDVHVHEAVKNGAAIVGPLSDPAVPVEPQ
jgi:hypothetical protein